MGNKEKPLEMLLKELNKWIVTFRKTSTYAMLYAKYFKNSRSSTIIKSDYFAISTGKVSPYDDIIKIYSDTIGWTGVCLHRLFVRNRGLILM